MTSRSARLLLMTPTAVPYIGELCTSLGNCFTVNIADEQTLFRPSWVVLVCGQGLSHTLLYFKHQLQEAQYHALESWKVRREAEEAVNSVRSLLQDVDTDP